MNESPTARFDRLAAEFHAETGLTAPGKDVAADFAVGSREDYDRRLDAWRAWLTDYTARTEADAARYRFLRDRLLWVQAELRGPRGPRGTCWVAENGIPFDAWVTALMQDAAAPAGEVAVERKVAA